MTDAIPSQVDRYGPVFRAGPLRARHRSRPSPRSPLRRTLSVLLFVFVAATLIVLVDFTRFAIEVGAHDRPVEARAEGIVALTGGVARIDGALELLAQNRAERVLISGVNPSVGRRDIASAVDTVGRGPLDPRVDLGHAARDTIGNADEARAWARDHNFRSLIVVTSDYHMPRSMVELASAMPDMRLIPYPVSNPQLDMERWWRHAASARLLMAEYVKYTLARARLVVESPWFASAS